LFAADILKVLYAPHKVFKQIVQNPKYWGAIVVLILFVATQIAAYYAYDLKNSYELTSPSGVQFGVWTQNSTLWAASSGAIISQNYDDAINSTFLGNSSLQFALSNSSNLSMELNDFNPVKSVDCGLKSFQNMSMRLKIVEPQTAPQKVTLYLYSLNSANYFQYDLTPEFSNPQTLGVWNNLTVPVGSGNWQSTGTPQWSNITGIKLNFAFPSDSNITLRVEGVFFRGMVFQGVYMYQSEIGSTGYVIYYAQLVLMQFLFEWLLLTALIYIFVKLLKANLVWKPLFVSIGLALIPLVIQALITLAATSTLHSTYYSVEVLAGMQEAQVTANAILAAGASFNLIITTVPLVMYVWITALGVLIVRSLLPEFSWMKSVMVSAASLVITIILMAYLLGV
jgi:hypothetical protein